MNEYELLFRQLKIEADPLPDNYSPDEYGYELIKDFQPHTEVSYSISTKLNCADN